MLEELVQQLAEFQTEMESIADQIARDETIREYVTGMAELEKQLSQRQDELHDLISGYGQDQIDERMNETKDQIIDEWTGEHKTMVFGDRVLKFTQRGSLKIHDEAWLLSDILDRMSAEDIIKKKYLKGFNLTAVKKYMSVIDLPIDVAEIEYKTTVKLEQM